MLEYQRRFPNRGAPNRSTFDSMFRRLGTNGSFLTINAMQLLLYETSVNTREELRQITVDKCQETSKNSEMLRAATQ